MEELEALDKKAIETAYVNSYNYTTSQRIVAVIAVLVVILVIIGAGTYLFLNVLNLIKP